jgi:hypothetical protein
VPAEIRVREWTLVIINKHQLPKPDSRPGDVGNHASMLGKSIKFFRFAK